MTVVIDLKESHLMAIELQKKQEMFYTMLSDEHYREAIIYNFKSYTIFDDDFKNVLACIGFKDNGGGRYQGWCLLSIYANKHLISITRFIIYLLESIDYQRFELQVEDGFEEGHRWARILGFQCETPNGMKNYFHGKNLYLYARYK